MYVGLRPSISAGVPLTYPKNVLYILLKLLSINMLYPFRLAYSFFCKKK